MTAPISLRELRERNETTNYPTLEPGELLALVEAVEAAQGLLGDLDDAIAGADLDAWDAPYRIEAPLFRESADKTRAALARFKDYEADSDGGE